MDISGLTNYSDFLNTAAKTQNTNAELTKKVEDAKETGQSEELLDACKQFEAYLWEQVYKAMEKTVDAFKSDDDDDGYASQMVDYFSGSAMQEIASRTTEGAEGQNSLAQTLYEQMKRNYGITD